MFLIICFNVEGALWINEKMEMKRMEIAVKEIYAETLEQQQIEVRQGVMSGQGHEAGIGFKKCRT